MAELQDAIPALKAVVDHKAGEDGVRAVVGRRFALYPQPPRSDAEWAAWWADYVDVLADVPLPSLEAGMRQWVSDPQSEFMPKPGQLRELAFTAPSQTRMRYYRAKETLRLVLEPPKPIKPHVGTVASTPVDPDEVKRWAAEFTAKAVRQASKLPSIAGKADASGITPQMRAIMERRANE